MFQHSGFALRIMEAGMLTNHIGIQNFLLFSGGHGILQPADVQLVVYVRNGLPDQLIRVKVDRIGILVRR